ncbi:MAG: T9SS type A sorting domain-containing protein [Bacteroidetes bacterium]|nr:T9SS type A sorting domain-containing protein [Bacteroidota bacterium]
MKNFTLFSLLVLLEIILSQHSTAQNIANYTTTRTTTITYNSISTTGNAIASWRNNGAYSQDDNRSVATDIGFDFWYNGTRYSQFNVSTNGYVDFSTSTADGGPTTGAFGYSNTAFSNTNAANRTYPALAPLYDDMTAQGGVDALGNSIKYLTTGTAPNRVLTIEWINMAVFGNTTPSLNFQVKLYETTGVIEYIYGTMTPGTAAWSYTCGINSQTASNTTANLKTQQTANTNTFSNTPRNNLSTLPANNSQITFTPPTTTPASPSGSLSFTAITQTGMTVNWTNWCTNEVGYVLYNSVDNVNFYFVTQTAANSTSYAASGLLPGTLYYWKLYAVTVGYISSELTGSQATNAAGNKVSTGNGNWNTTGSWSPSGIPTAADNVTIRDGHTITINATSVCNNLTVGEGASGILRIGNNNTARTITVNNDVVINGGGQFIANTGSTATHNVTLTGNITNNGILNFASDGNSFANVTFNKNGNQTVSGTGGTTNFNRITLNMGSSLANVLDITTSSFSVATTNFLTLNSGTFKLSTPATVSLTPFTALATINSNSGIECNSSLTTWSFPAGISLSGNLIVNSGIVNVGDAANENVASNGGVFQIYGGVVNIAGQYYSANINTLANFTISGGTLTLPTVSSTSTTIAPFHIDGAGSTFNMSGGTIIIQREGGSGAQNLGYTVLDISSSAVTGGTLQIGNTLTPAGQIMSINSSAQVGSLLINSANATGFLTTNSLTVTNDVTISSGTLNTNNLNLTLGGNWLDNGTFTPGTGTVTFNGTNQSITKTTGETFYNLVLDGSGTKTLGGNVSTTNDLTINSTAILDITTNNYAVNIGRNWTNNGNFIAQSGTVTFNGSAAQTIGGTTVTNFNNITLNNAAGASLTNAQNLIGTLTLSVGTFATNSQTFTLLSDINGTARIASIPAGADITGDITMQRYIGAGATNWRFLTTAVSGTTLADWDDNIITSGFAGSQYPNWPSVSNPWVNIYFYDETVPGVQDSGYVAASNITNNVSPGQGLWVWAGDTSIGTQAFTIDVVGPANKGNINLPVTFTSSAGSADDGWNMVGNPYPSTIDWDSPNWTKTGINAAIYIWNPQIQQFASYVFGIGTNGGSRYISSSQAFWVQTNTASPVVQITENCKSAVDQDFMRDAVSDQQLLTFGVQKGTKYDEAILRFIDGATENFDADFDALKIASADVDMPYIALLNSTNEYSVNSYNLGQNITMPVKVLSNTNGITTLTFTKTNLIDLSCAVLEDLVTGTKTDVIANSSYTFYHTSATDTARFILHLWNNKAKEVVAPTCFDATNGEIISQTSGNGPWTFNLNNDIGTVTSFNSTNDTTIINNLGAGTYYLQISDQSLTCGITVDTIVISNPTPVFVSSAVTTPSSFSNDGAIDLTVIGGVSPYQFNWNNGETTEDLVNLTAGVYEVIVIDANGCSTNEVFTLDFSTSINNLSNNNSIALYPNPAKDVLVLEGQDLTGTTLTLTTISGQVVLTKNLTSTKETLTISNLSSGVYFYELNNKTIQQKGKLVVVTR